MKKIKLTNRDTGEFKIMDSEEMGPVGEAISDFPEGHEVGPIKFDGKLVNFHGSDFCSDLFGSMAGVVGNFIFKIIGGSDAAC
jgi:hypothetical protein